LYKAVYLSNFVPPPLPSHVPLVPSEEQLEDLGDGMERTLQVVEDLLARADAARAGLHAGDSNL
jgi:hypothetical protein